MVPKVRDDQLRQLRLDVERERTNALICLHPAISRVSARSHLQHHDLDIKMFLHRRKSPKF